jgi:hypothetical protein
MNTHRKRTEKKTRSVEPKRLEMGHVDTILFLSLSTQRSDDVVEIAYSTQNFMGRNKDGGI